MRIDFEATLRHTTMLMKTMNKKVKKGHTLTDEEIIILGTMVDEMQKQIQIEEIRRS